ncbi:MAG: glutamyl-tRNA reductase, partial [Ignavibacterium sp.]
MNFLAISINHRTAPVELREALHLSEDEVRRMINNAKENLFNEGLILSTCNRTEIYGIPKDPELNHSQIQKLITDNKKDTNTSSENFQTFISRDTVKHLFSVATGIDSMLIGDNQIYKQVKDS